MAAHVRTVVVPEQIAAIVGCAQPTVATWRRRYAESGLAGLEDLTGRANHLRCLNSGAMGC